MFEEAKMIGNHYASGGINAAPTIHGRRSTKYVFFFLYINLVVLCPNFLQIEGIVLDA